MSRSADRLAVAAHLHVLLRRKLGRITDTEWMAANDDYARHILTVCRGEDDEALHEWATRLESLMTPPAPVMPPRVPEHVRVATALLEQERKRQLEQRYVGRLR